MDPTALPYLKDHRLHGRLVLPGAVYVEMAVAAAKTLGQRAVCLTAVEFQRAAFVKKDRPFVLDGVLTTTSADGAAIFRVFSETRDPARATPHVTMRVQDCADDTEAPVNLEALRQRCPDALPAARFYDELRNRGNDYGAALQGIAQLWRGQREAIASLEVPVPPSGDADGFYVHPVLIDSCAQLALAADDARDVRGSFLLAIDEIRFVRSPGARCWAHARLRPVEGSAADSVADIRLLNAAGEIVVALSGVRFRALAAPRPTVKEPEARQPTVAVSATFTAEPVEDSVAFWMRELQVPGTVVFTPYNQPFHQLLDPQSVLATNRNGLNVMLLRVEDWIPRDRRDGDGAGEFVDAPVPPASRYVLPNGLAITHLNQYETEYIYDEIFRNEAYLRHGVVLRDGDCVIDVGANIGLFTLFVLGKCRRPRVYGFEPSPAAFDVLAANVAPHRDDVKVFNIGLSDHDGRLPFTVYRNSTLFSGYYADEEQDRAAMAAIVRNVLRGRSDGPEDTVHRVVEELVDTRIKCETITSPVRTLGGIIKEERLDRIDLLKIDAEKSELAILRGLGDADWGIIRQIVVEVHDLDGGVRRQIQRLLDAHGFAVTCDQDPLLRESGLSTLYAIRPTDGVSPVNGTPTIESNNLERTASDFIRAMTVAAKRSSTPYLVCLCPPSASVLRDATQREQVDAIEARLARELPGLGTVHVVTAAQILETYPVRDWGDPRGHEPGHVPYTSEFYAAVGTVIARRVHALWRTPYKVIVLDGDGTLWHGRCGEDPPAALELDAGRRSLQEFMWRQHHAGMLLVLCSKNNEDDVLDVFTHRPEMRLTLKHFVARRINWKPKSENVSELAAELGLGLDSFIFVDDDPNECAEMRARCPDVVTLQLPAAADKIPKYLDHVWAFDHAGVTAEDVQRPAFYRQESSRRELRRSALTFADFLASLDVRVSIAAATPLDVPRIAELTRRTNQFNVTTIRRSESEIREWLQNQDLECLVVDVADRFGHYGLVGTILLTTGTESINVDTFLLSCRALGRRVEHRMLAWLGKLAIERGRERVDIPFVPTGRNQPALTFLQEVGSDFVDLPGGSDERAARIFRFPARFAAEVADRQSVDPRLELTARETAREEGAAAYESERRPAASTFHRIATELDDVARILAARRERDRAERPAADALVPSDDDVAGTVAAVWRDVLGIERVGVNDNILDLGGTSLELALVAAELERRLNVDVSFVSLLDKTTVGSMARLLKNQGKEGLAEDMATSRRRGEQRRAHALAGLRQQ